MSPVSRGEAGERAVLDQVEPGEARRLLEAGFAATDMTWEPELPDSYYQFRALSLARCRALPEPARGNDGSPELDDVQRGALVEEFLAAPHAAGLPDRRAAAYCARLIVDFGCDYDSGRPMRVSPAKTETFLLDWLPRKAVLDAADRDDPAAFDRDAVNTALARVRLRTR